MTKNIAEDYAEPWKSCVWKDFGWGGLYRNGYCVRDGTIYRNLSIDYEPRCLKRQWNDDNTMPPIYPPEMDAFLIQNSPDPATYLAILSGFHFMLHLPVGGWSGDKSVPWAPHE